VLCILSLMSFNIEVLSVGGDFDTLIQETAQMLNGVQAEFQFGLVPTRLRRYAADFRKSEYLTTDVFAKLQEYRSQAKGHRPFVVAVVDKKLRSKKRSNLFGSRDARDGEGEAVITLQDHHFFTESTQLYLSYYFIRYALSFVCPSVKNHE